MTRDELRIWRKGWGLKQRELAQALGVKNLAVSRWERGERGIPALLPLALEALENRLKEGGRDGSLSGVPRV
jgi:transcriptional regulator with XRE-family HTH domain